MCEQIEKKSNNPRRRSACGGERIISASTVSDFEEREREREREREKRERESFELKKKEIKSIHANILLTHC